MEKKKVRKCTEFYINLYQKYHKKQLEEVTGLEFNKIVLEKYFYGQKIDVFSTLKDSEIPVYIESMIGTSDKRHLSFLMKLIEKVDIGIIVFEATTISDSFIEKVVEKILKQNKKIDLYMVSISDSFIGKIEKLNKIHLLQVVEEIKKLEIDNPFILLDRYIFKMKDSEVFLEETGKLSRIEKRNRLFFEEIRKKIYFFPNVFREKRVLSNRIITMGAGRTAVDYHISIEDRYGNSFVSLRFQEETKSIYQVIKKKKGKMEKRIGCKIDFDDDMLIIRSDVEDTFIYRKIDEVVELLKTYIINFTNDIVYYSPNEMKATICEYREDEYQK